MPTSGKVFVYRETKTLEEIKVALEGYEEEIDYEDPDLDVTLKSNITRLELDQDLVGLYQTDSVDHKIFRGRESIQPYTTEAPFLITEYEGKLYLIVLIRKAIANKVANTISLILHEELGAMTEPRINPERLREFCEKSEAIKVLLFDEIDIPNLDKTTLYGLNVVQTDMYGKFVDSGLFRYTVMKMSTAEAFTVGLVRDGTVVIFTSVDSSQFIEFIKDKILPLIIRR